MIDRESGIAYGLVAITVFLIGGGLIYILMTPLVTGLSGAVNTEVGMHQLSTQTVNAYQWNETMFRYGVPIAMLVGAVLFGVIRALYRRRVDQYG